MDWVVDWSGCDAVETVPGKVLGQPLLRGTRVPADAVVENYEAGESVEAIAYKFDLNADEVRRVLAYAAARQLVKLSR
jgi:uncharacterized protein (DUF433 family)